MRSCSSARCASTRWACLRLRGPTSSVPGCQTGLPISHGENGLRAGTAQLVTCARQPCAWYHTCARFPLPSWPPSNPSATGAADGVLHYPGAWRRHPAGAQSFWRAPALHALGVECWRRPLQAAAAGTRACAYGADAGCTACWPGPVRARQQGSRALETTPSVAFHSQGSTLSIPDDSLVLLHAITILFGSRCNPGWNVSQRWLRPYAVQGPSPLQCLPLLRSHQPLVAQLCHVSLGALVSSCSIHRYSAGQATGRIDHWRCRRAEGSRRADGTVPQDRTVHKAPRHPSLRVPTRPHPHARRPRPPTKGEVGAGHARAPAAAGGEARVQGPGWMLSWANAARSVHAWLGRAFLAPHPCCHACPQRT